MEQRIKAVLAEAKDAETGCEKIGGLWQVWVGSHGGARADGVSLARFLVDKHKHARPVHKPEKASRIAHPKPSVSGEAMRGAAPEAPATPEPPTVIEKTVEVEKVIENPETQERLAEALRKLSEAEAALDARKAGSDIPPPDIADLIRLNESYERTNERLVEGYRDAMQRAELARTRDGTFEGKSTTEWLRKAERYDSAIRWNKGRSAETI